MDSRVASPADDDLDFSVQNLILENIVRFDGDVLITGKEGKGWWLQSDGERCHGHDVEFQATVGSETPGYIDAILGQLEEWQERQTRVHVTSAPGKLTSITDGQVTVPLPRKEWSPNG